MRTSPSPLQPTRRQGVVLLAVLVVVVLLSLAAYNYSDLMLAEYKASDNYHKNAQARAFADSGVHYALALLATQDNISTLLNDNPYDNALMFKDRAVMGSGGDKGTGYFSLIAPLDAGDSGATGVCRYGVVDEASKININSMMKSDASGEELYKMLLLLPNMTDEIANSIVDWLDTDSSPRQGGAENDYYSALAPPYQCKNGPLDSTDELLLVKGVTRQLLFGSDLNRNGFQDRDETGSESTGVTGFDRGWAAYLTIYSREQNIDAGGLALTNLNDSAIDVATMYDTLSAKLGDDMAKFIIMARQFGTSAGTATTSSPSIAQMAAQALAAMFTKTSSKSSKTTSSSQTRTGYVSEYQIDPNKKASKKIGSLYDLINAQVTIEEPDPQNPKRQIKTIYKSPLSDATLRADLLPKIFQNTTIFAATEIPARINVNTASAEVLAALPGLTAADVQAIMGARPQYSSADAPGAIYQTPAWLITQANINPEIITKNKLERLITARSQVYRVQALGYFDAAKGPLVRVEAVIDTNNGQPRILTWRDLGDYGRVRPPQ
jgi:type II secretory pathway component PulK